MLSEGSKGEEVFLLAVILIALVLVPVFGGRLLRLADIDLKATWAIAVALGLQILIVSVFPDRFEGMHVPVHLLSYGFAGYFVWANRRIPGVLVIGAGAALNFLAIFANGGVMPARAEALRTAGIVNPGGEFTNSGVVEDPKLAFLGDIFAIPESWPIVNNVYSVGDILIAIGAFIVIHAVCGSKLVPQRWRTTTDLSPSS